MPRFTSRFLWLSLLVAWAVDYLFWGKIPGISFPLWVFIALLVGFILARGEGVRPAFPSYILGLIALILALITFYRQEPITRLVNAGLSLCVLLLMAATLRNGFWIYYRIWDYVTTAYHFIISMFGRPIEILKSRPDTSSDKPIQSPLRQFFHQALPVFTGLLIALPIVLVLGALLSLADPIFNDWLVNLLGFLDLGRIPEYIFRLFYVVVIFGYLFTGIYLHAILPKQQEARPDHERNWLKPFLGWTESTVILICVNLLFTVFVFIQFRYLFGGNANISETAYTYSEYARRGFGELLAVAIISLFLYLILGAITRQKTSVKHVIFSVLAVVLMGLVLIMLASAFQRLFLYENAYGFTRLRIYTHVFIAWLAVLLAASILFEIIRRRGTFVLALLLCIFGFCFTLGIINVDGLIVRQNVQRVYLGEEFDSYYIKTLSSDAIPALIKGYRWSDLPDDVHDQIGMELACRVADLIPQDNEKPLPWQSYHLGESMANQSLLQNWELWKDRYQLYQDDKGWVVDLGSIKHECYEFYRSMD